VTRNLDPQAVREAISPRTRAIVAVHLGGHPADIAALRAIAAGHGLVLIEDAAHAIEAVSSAGKVGTTADFTCFSFYSTKNLTTGEGGMLTTPHADAEAFVRTAALHGLSRNGWSRYAQDGSPHYDVLLAGLKYNMMDLQAAIGRRQRERLDALDRRRAAMAARYDDACADLPIVTPAPVRHGERHAHHLYAVLIEEPSCGRTRDALQQALAARGIGTSIHFRALHLHSFYAERFGLARGMFPQRSEEHT